MIAGGARQRFTLNLRAKTEILLGNAAVVAASAIEGRIADPRKYLARSKETETP